MASVDGHSVLLENIWLSRLDSFHPRLNYMTIFGSTALDPQKSVLRTLNDEGHPDNVLLWVSFLRGVAKHLLNFPDLLYFATTSHTADLGYPKNRRILLLRSQRELFL